MTAVEVQGDILTVKSTGAGSGRGGKQRQGHRLRQQVRCRLRGRHRCNTQRQSRRMIGSTFAGWSGALQRCANDMHGNGPGRNRSDRQLVPGWRLAVAEAVVSGGGSGGLTLKVATSNPGTVTSNVGGINCGNVCQTNYAAAPASR